MILVKNIKKFDKSEADKLYVLYKEGFPEDGGGFIDWFFRSSDCTVIYDSEYGGVAFLPEKTMRYSGNTITVNYITAFTVEKKRRGTGLAAEIMKECLSYLNGINCPFVVLYPFNRNYYRQYAFTDADNALEDRKIIDYDKEYSKSTDKIALVITNIYNQLIKKYDNYLQLNYDTVKKFVLGEFAGGAEAKLLKCGDSVSGVEFFQDGKPYFRITDDSVIGGEPNCQARVVDVIAALTAYDYGNIYAEHIIKITDSFTGDKIVSLRITNGKASAEFSDSMPDTVISAEELTEALLTGRIKKESAIAYLFKRSIAFFIDKY